MPSDAPRILRDVLFVLVAFAVTGALAGLLWYAWWRPAPTGIVLRGYPYFKPDAEFRSTGMYVVIAAPAGILLGVLSSWRWRTDARFTVVAVLVGAAVAATVMGGVGHLLGPAAALEVARGAADFDEVRADLRVQPGVAWLAFPLGALLGALAHLLSGVDREPESSPPD